MGGSDVDVYVFAADLAREDLRALGLAATGAVFQPNAPAMPTANHLALLHDALTQRKAEMGAQIFDGKHLVFPAEQCDLKSRSFKRLSETFALQFANVRDANPIGHVTDVILKSCPLCILPGVWPH